MWRVYADAATDPVTDAVNTIVFNGAANLAGTDDPAPPNTFAPAETVFQCNGTEGLRLNNDGVKVPPGGTTRFLVFHQLHDSIANATPAAQAFSTALPRGTALVNDLSDTALVEIAN